MKKYIYTLVILLLCISGADSRKVEAYSVTVEKDGIYAEVIPDSLVNNTGTIFKNYVKKAMKYYNKYKDADDYTYVSKVPEEYRDFIPVAKQIQDSDKIIIRNPFYIYETMDDIVCLYSFFAEKNGEKLCMFSIYIEPEDGEISFRYDKMMDSYFTYDEKTLGETLFYEIDETIYAETPDQTSVVRDMKAPSGGVVMMGGDGNVIADADWAAIDNEFKKKSYSEKKDEILADLENRSQEKIINKVEKNLKLELEDEYVEPEKDAKESDRSVIYIVIGIGIIVIIGVISGIILLKKQEKE